MSLELVKELWEYHHWANRRLFDVTAPLGDELAAREVGAQFSEPTLGRMLTHIYGSDAFWLARWTGEGPSEPPGDDIVTLAQLRPRWDELVAEQQRFLDGLRDGDLARILQVTLNGQTIRRPLGALLLHVPNHATHHRSEIATMLTMVSGSPPDTGINSFYRETSR